MTTPTTVRIVRDFTATVDEVFAAWLDPASVAQWMTPGTEATAEIDPFVGGHYRVHHTRDGQDAGGFDATITVLVPPRRMAWDWSFVGPGAGSDPIPSTLEITLTHLPNGGTRLTLVHTRLDQLHAQVPSVAENVEAGWMLVLGKLASRIPAPR